jgi:glycosyltransferase involved in cell wall biosynthesis
MHIVFIISSLGCGGAERVLCNMANHWAEVGHPVSIITLSEAENSAYELHSAIALLGLGRTGESRHILHGVYQNIGRVAKLKQAIKNIQPDIVISFMDRTNITVLIALLGLKIPIIITEHCDPSQTQLGQLWGGLRRITYPWANSLVSVSLGVDACFSWMPAEKRLVIYNPIHIVDFISDPDDPSLDLDLNKKYLVGMGRLAGQKGFDLLIPAFSKIAAENPEWSVILLGEGAQRPALAKLIDEHGLGERFMLPGRFKNPFSILQQCDIFVFPSRYEGFPCALLEAMACGLPAISFDCPYGPKEIIHPGEDGVLVPPGDIDAFAAAMNALMNDARNRQQMAEQARQNALRFGLDSIMREWDRLIAAIMSRGKPSA